MEVRFIEMMPIGEGSAFPPVKNETIQKRLEEVYGEFVQTEQDDREGPAVYYTNAHFKGRIGFISPVSRSFCHQPNLPLNLPIRRLRSGTVMKNPIGSSLK